MATYLIDTNVLTCILQKRSEADRRVGRRLEEVLGRNDEVIMCPIVYYEVARGLYHKNARMQLDFLRELADNLRWCDLGFETWDKGAQLWADVRRRGLPTGEGIDADALIAAQAQEFNAVVVTNNQAHFRSLNVPCENWQT